MRRLAPAPRGSRRPSMREGGLEPPRLAAREPKSRASTSSATLARPACYRAPHGPVSCYIGGRDASRGSEVGSAFAGGETVELDDLIDALVEERSLDALEHLTGSKNEEVL